MLAVAVAGYFFHIRRFVQLVQRGAEAASQNDEHAGNVDPKQEKEQTADRAVEVVVVDEARQVIHETDLAELSENRDDKRREPDLAEVHAPPWREHVEEREGVKE